MLPMAAPFLSLMLLAPATDGWLGIYLEPEREEAVVSLVMRDSPAEKAGLQIGDVLLAVGDKATTTRDAFVAAIRACKAGDRITLKIQRAGKEQLVAVKLGERPEQPVATPAPGSAPGKPAQPAQPAPIAQPSPTSESKPGGGRGYLGLGVGDSDDGVLVQRLIDGGPAAKAGLQVGDVIQSVAGARVRSLADLDEVLRARSAGQQVELSVRSAKGVRSVLVTLAPRPTEPERAIAAAPVETVASGSPAAPSAPAAPTTARKDVDLEAEIAALRAELVELRQQLEALRRAKGRE